MPGSVTARDRDIVRRLAGEIAEIAALPIHTQKAEMWRSLNDLRPVRPMVWVNEIPWHEMNVDGELTPQAADAFWRSIEAGMRMTLYLWRHMPVDMIVEPRWYSPLVIQDTGFGIDENVRIVRTDDASDIVSREFHRQINDERDLEKIKNPVLSHDRDGSERYHRWMSNAFGDVLPVEKVGVVHRWFAPWDELIRWWTVQAAMEDLILRPELVHAAMDRLVNAYIARLDQWEKLNVLSFTEGNFRVGSGGLAYTSELPAAGFDPTRVRTRDQWGCATAQIFSDVSPAMHMEFALKYELRWLERFGMNYYGCCEPLHTKIDVLRAIPNLRKVSVSPRCDVEKMVEGIGGKYVLSIKPNPAILATDRFNEDLARQELRAALDPARGCSVEVIMKDISTVRYDPRRLWRWCEIAMEVVREYG